MSRNRSIAVALLAAVSACSTKHTGTAVPVAANGGPTVGPAHGAVMVVGGGAQGPEVFAKLIELAGGPDALIVEVPTAGGDSVDLSTVGRGLRAAGARNVVVYHTTSKAVADADTFVAKIANARGIWFGGGRHFRLVNSYAGTKSERAFQAVLDRGGVIGGSSAGASILASYLVRGAPSNDNRIFSHPKYLTGFGYLRGVAIDQHVVARERLADMHDSLTSRRKDLLGISEDEGTVWLVQGDSAVIMGRNKAFVYNGRDANDPGKPFLTLHPGDRYNLASRRLIARANAGTALTQQFIDEQFAAFRDASRGGAQVVVAQDGRVLANGAYGIAPQRRYLPETGAVNFPLGGLGAMLDVALTPDSTGRIGAASVRRALGVGGMQRVTYDSATKAWNGSVDDLYRFEQGRTMVRPALRATPLAAYGTPDGKRAAWVRIPDKKATIIILTGDDNADAKGIASRIAERLPAK